jgi:hypothetical protein
MNMRYLTVATSSGCSILPSQYTFKDVCLSAPTTRYNPSIYRLADCIDRLQAPAVFTGIYSYGGSLWTQGTCAKNIDSILAQLSLFNVLHQASLTMWRCNGRRRAEKMQWKASIVHRNSCAAAARPAIRFPVMLE